MYSDGATGRSNHFSIEINKSITEHTGMEVTPAMIDAGADVLAAFDLTFADERCWAARAFAAMSRAAAVVSSCPLGKPNSEGALE
jgi:hypothetical protein